MKKKISIVVAIYNVAQYLEQCIQSLIDQDYSMVEIILVNDGSTDNSLEICQKFAKIDDRIILINQLNQGANIARNKGTEIAKGDWIAYVDGDDYVEKNIYSALVNYLDKPYDMIFFTNSIKESNGKKRPILFPKYSFELNRDNGDFEELKKAALNHMGNYKFNRLLSPVSIWNKLYKKDFLERNSLIFTPKFPKLQDIAFNLDVYAAANNAVFINNPGYVYRINQQSITHRFQPDITKKLNIVSQWMWDYIQEQKNTEDLIEAYYERIITLTRTSVVRCFCNFSNQKTYKNRKKDFLNFVSLWPYEIALKKGNWKNFPIKERILGFAIKIKCFALCEILQKLYEVKSKLLSESF